MPVIIAATNFSETAENAVHYACKLAEDCDASIIVLHSFIIPITYGDTPMPVMPLEEGRELAEERMNKLMASLKAAYPTIQISSKITYGDMVDNLEELTEDSSISLAVIGNSGVEEDMLWLGSNVVTAMRNLRLPVLAIPPNFTYYKTSNICYTCDFKNIDAHTVNDVHSIIKMTGARLHILNVNKEAANRDNHNLLAPLDDLSPVYHEVANEHTDQAIQSFIEANKMDWLIVVPHKHSFFESLFHKSHTKSLIKTSHIPILALHEQ